VVYYSSYPTASCWNCSTGPETCDGTTSPEGRRILWEFLCKVAP